MDVSEDLVIKKVANGFIVEIKNSFLPSVFKQKYDQSDRYYVFKSYVELILFLDDLYTEDGSEE